MIQKQNKLEVWLSIDHRTADCGFVAAASLLKHRPKDAETTINVAYVKQGGEPAGWWYGKLRQLGYRFEFNQVGMDLSGFYNCKGLFDSHAAYLRLLIPHYATQETIIYTDADVVFQEDVFSLLEETDLHDAPLGMIRSGKCALQPDRERGLLQSYGKGDEIDYFFSGLAVINVLRYKAEQILEKSLHLANTEGHQLSYHDQTIWNCVIENPAVLNNRWSHLAFPGDKKPFVFEGGIVHFMGSPKPWDLLGEFYHPYHDIWETAASSSGLEFPRIRKYLDPENWKRAYRIRNQYKTWLS